MEIGGKTGTKWQCFVATDAVKDPALVPKYTTILHVATAGRGLRVYAEQFREPSRGWLGTLASRNVPEKGYPLRGQNEMLWGTE